MQSVPFYPEDVTRAVESVDPSGIEKVVADAVQQILEAADARGWNEQELEALTDATVYDALAQQCRERADNSVAFARKYYGTTWGQVAQVTGYSNPATASRRYGSAQRERNQEAEHRSRLDEKVD